MIRSIKQFLGDLYFLSQVRAIHELTRMDPVEKRSLLASYANQFDVFVETGTYLGLTAAFLAPHYKRIHTIEFDRKLYDASCRRLEPFANVHCHHGDSTVVLPEILGQLDRPAVFWLDAHYTGGITARSGSNTPILAEMDAVLAHPVDTHLILIDDARWFVGRNGYPGVRKLHAHVRNNSPYDMVIHDDIIRIFRDDEWTRPEQVLAQTSAKPAQSDPATAGAAGWAQATDRGSP